MLFLAVRGGDPGKADQLPADLVAIAAIHRIENLPSVFFSSKSKNNRDDTPPRFAFLDLPSSSARSTSSCCAWGEQH